MRERPRLCAEHRSATRNDLQTARAPLKIRVSSENGERLGLRAQTERLLSVVDDRDLLDLEEIDIRDELTQRSKGACAAYLASPDGPRGRIEISVPDVFAGLPRFFLLIPGSRRFVFAHALFHEIGHHVHHRRQHGINKRKVEQFAERYADAHLLRAFRTQLLFLVPFGRLLRWLVKRGAAKGRA